MPLCGRRLVTFEEQAEDAEDIGSSRASGSEAKELDRLRAWLLPKTANCFYYGDQRFHVRHWLPAKKVLVRGSIFYIHGLNGHTNRPTLNFFMQGLTSAGYAVLGFDLEGNGFSDGLRAYVQDFEHVFDSVLHFIALVLSSDPLASKGDHLGLSEPLLVELRERPFFLFGESMGGMLAMYVSARLSGSTQVWAQRHAGAILIAPALKVNIPSRTMVLCLQTAVVPCFGKQPMPEGVSSSSKPAPELVCRNLKALEISDMDDWTRFPGVGLGWKGNMRWATASAFATLYAGIDDEMRKVSCPLLVIHDPDDAICASAGSKRLLELCNSDDTKYVEAPGALHDVTQNEPKWSQEQILAWLADRS